MLIILYGEDTYGSRQKLNAIIEHYKKIHKSGLNLKYFDGEILNFEDIKNEIQTSSMFKEKKLIIFKNIFSSAQNEEDFLKFLKKLKNSTDILLIYEEKEIKKNSSLFQYLKKNGKCQKFSLPVGQKLKSWLKKEVDSYQTEIEPEALDLLINYIGSDLWQLSNEVKKLVSFKAGKKIEIKDVELLVKPKIETNIFKTIDAIALKDKRKALSFLHKHLERGDPPLYLLSMINYQFRNLLIIKDLIEKNRPYYTILKITKFHPFVVQKSYQQANKFTFRELKKIYQKILQVDLDIKTGKITPEVALDLLLTEI